MSENFLNALKKMDNFTETENGAVALNSTLNHCLDAFGSLGAMKDSPEEKIISTFMLAFAEDKELAMRMLFYMRDIRGGQGMRRVFRVIATHLANNYPNLMIKNLDNFLFFGRGDDVLCLLDTPIRNNVITWIAETLGADIDAVKKNAYPSMLAKWLPSENASSKETKRYARMIAAGLGLNPRDYRVLLSKLRAKIGIVETLMSQNKWEEIEFEKLPSRAAMIYSDAFMRHVEEKYVDYFKRLAAGDAKVNAGALFPVDIIHKVAEKVPYYNGYYVMKNTISLKDKYLLTAMWNALPNYLEDKEETGLCVVDTSGSMHGTPLDVAISLGLYCADKAKGPFHNHFITFSANPKLQEVIGDTIDEKYANLCRADWDQNTNLEAVFSLILSTAIANNTPQEDLPSKLYIISDMQFDQARGGASSYWGYRNNHYESKTFMASMKEKYANAGYTMPAIVYWNVRASNCGMFQETFEGENCAMVSGYSPSLFKAVIEGTEWVEEEIVAKTGERKTVVKQKIDPIEVMRKTLMNERYDRVLV